MIVKDVCMRTVVCTVQGSLFVQHLIRIKKKKKKERNQLIFFVFTAVGATTLMYKTNV